MDFFNSVATLFLVLDPLGCIPIVHILLSRVPPERRRKVLIRELFIALGILLLFLFIGGKLLGFLGVAPETLRISGGIILFIIALGMVFPAKSVLTAESSQSEAEPLVVPLAIPLIAGPSAIALCILNASKYPDEILQMTAATVVAWAATTIILLVSPVIVKVLHQRGMMAMERLMGLILMLISIQMFIDGIRHLANQ